MKTEQFIKLTEAYGGDIKHWPEFYQPQAAEIISLNLPEVNQVLEQARLLDRLFSSHEVEPLERSLFENIILYAPQAKKGFWQKFNIGSWLSFSGLIGTGIAGALAGAFFVSIWGSGIFPSNLDGLGESAGTMAQFEDASQEWT